MLDAKCPHCGQAVRCDTSHGGKLAACPRCKKRFTLPASPPPEEGILTALPANPPPVPVAEEAEPELAQEVEPGLDAAWYSEVDSAAEADTALAAWKAAMPEAPSAYQPSGALPILALLLMVVGMLLGAVVGTVAEAVVGAIVALLVWLAAFLNALLAFCGFIWFFLLFVFFVVAVIAALAPFAAGGWAAALTTTQLGRWGKNRNTAAAGVLSGLSALLSVFLLWLVFRAYVQAHLDACMPFLTTPHALHLVYRILILIGGFVAPFAAMILARDTVHEARFCELCSQYMMARGTRHLGLGSLRALAAHLTAQRLEVGARVVRAPSGNEGEAALYRCPECGQGYLDVKACFKATWREKKEEKEKTETWRVASVALTAEQAERYQAAVGKEAARA